MEPLKPEQKPVTVARARAEFLRDARARELRRPTLYKYRLLLRRLRDFAKDRGIRFIAELSIEDIRAFRAGWPDHNLSALKKLERLRAFFRFCQESDWIDDNPGRKLKNPKITSPPTMPFTKEQVASILAACRRYPDRRNAARVRALVLLLRYSGLRIRDAVTLTRDRIHDEKLFLYTAKTDTAVWCPLPPFVVEGGSYPGEWAVRLLDGGNRNRKAQWVTGSAPFVDCLVSREYPMVTRIGLETHSPWSSCSREFPWSAFPSFLDTRA